MLTFDEESHTYTNDGIVVPSVTQILVDLCFINTHWFTEISRNRGTEVHNAVKTRACGAGCRELPLEWQGYMEGYKAFERDCHWKPYLIEQPLACNVFAGTPDQMGLLNTYDSVLDIKTGEVGPATGLQLQGYKDLNGMQTDQRRFALQLTKEGKYRLTEYRDRSDQYIWRSSVAIWHWKRNHGV